MNINKIIMTMNTSAVYITGILSLDEIGANSYLK